MDDVRYVYVRNITRPVTIAYMFDDKDEQIVYNFAECSKKDQFIKSVGRAVATGRLLSDSHKHPSQRLPYVVTGTKYNSIASALYDEFVFTRNEAS